MIHGSVESCTPETNITVCVSFTGIAVCKTKIIAIVNSEEIWESHHPVTLFIFQKQRGEGKGTEGKGEGTEGQWTIVIMLFLSNIYFFACIRMNV